ncbi:MAG: hypothetical protein WEC00_00370 [Dongiaceae bacterium]
MAVDAVHNSKPDKSRKQRVISRAHTTFALSLWTLFELMPMRWASAVGGFVAAHLIYHLPFTRHVRTNTQVIFPELTKPDRDRLVRRMLWNVGRTFAEYPHLGRLTDPHEAWVTIKGWDIYEFATRGHRPAIFVSGHMANWEVTAGTGARRGAPLTVVYAPRRGAALNRRLSRYRAAMKCRLTPRGDAARVLLKSLMQGECVGIIIDQRDDDGIDVPFFGIPAPTTPAPARLAIKFNALIVPVECRRVGGTRFEMVFHEPIRPEDFVGKPDPVHAITERMNQHLEAWIRDHPEDWLCRRKRWAKKRGVPRATPAGAAENR